ncbi:hypothetical protein [Haloarcula marina]|uniref:hypothetical protein n=1 Tax=Haloarcula marina TaxID=2961574 RepID=UPI0020B88452|nr:hypothetical protein [Halomicroarcula marina]
MANDRLYPFWDDLEAALQTGETQNELEDPDTHPFEGVVYHDAGFEGGEARELPGPETMVVARR